MRTGPRARPDVAPLSWELPAAAALTWLVTSLLLLPAARALTCALFGGGWAWPRGEQRLLASIHGLASGHIAAGLTTAQAGTMPTPGWVYFAIVAGEVLLASATLYALALWWRRLGPGAHPGMATRAEAEAALGLSRLRRARRLIRPDLHRRTRVGTDS
jgi:hypothetical protein